MRPSFVLLIVLFCCTAFNAQVKQNEIQNSTAKFQTLSDSVNEAWVARYNGPGNDWDEAFAIAIDNNDNVYVTGGSPGQDLTKDYATIKYNSSGVQEWAARYNGSGNAEDEARAIAVDASGNVYVTGYSYGAVSSDYATVKYDSSGTELWAARFNGSANNDDRATSIAVDNYGNVYVTGISTGLITDYDYVTIKYNSAGTEQWTVVYNGPGNFIDYACKVAVDDSGNVYVTGWSANINGFNDFATVKYDTNGVQKWAARYHGPVSESDEACYDMAVDCLENVYVTGGGVGETSGRDYTTIKYNPSGTEAWVAIYNGPDNDFDVAQAIAVDCGGNVYVTGKSAGANTNLDYLTIKYNSSGAEEWASRYDGGANAEDGATAIAIDNSGNIYVTGESMNSSSDFDYATVKYNPSGIEEWVSSYNGPGNGDDWCTGISVNNSGNVFVTGYSFDTNSSYDYATIKYQETFVPVELASFSAEAVENSVVLNWTTSTEINNKGFDIERQVHNKWEKIGFVGGSGTTTETKAYSFTDNNVAAGNFRYRLKQIDLNGSYKYSNEIAVSFNNLPEFSLYQNYPNPFNPETNISFRLGSDSKVILEVYNILGQKVAVPVYNEMAAGEHNIKFDASDLSSGIYFYTLKANSIGGTSRLITKKMILLK
jgi:uncharacterized delta-60 repeat protein